MKRAVITILLVLLLLWLCSVFLPKYTAFFDAGRFDARVSALGIGVLVVLVPYALIMLCDTLGWLLCFDKVRGRIRFRKLLLIRIATETLQISLPGGAVCAEMVRPWLLQRHLNVGYPRSIAANTVTKINILVAQVVFVLIGILIAVAYPAGNQAETGALLRGSFHAGAATFVLIPLLLAYLVYCRHLLARFLRLLEKIPLKVVRRVLTRIRVPLREVDETIALFAFRNRSRLVLTILVFLCSWAMMACESLLIVRVMGVDATILQLIVVESLISLVRVAFFFIPGAAGAQDAGIGVLFSLAGIADPMTNALLFVMIRRAKELTWIVAGYIILISLGVKIHELLRRKEVNLAGVVAER